MKLGRRAGALLICALAVGNLYLSAGAVWTDGEDISTSKTVVPEVTEFFASKQRDEELGYSMPRSSYFSMNISPGALSISNESFSMEKGESVTIKCTYSPRTANLDFGLLASDGSFYYVTATDGSIDCSLQASKRDRYTLAIRNNSTDTVAVMGFLND